MFRSRLAEYGKVARNRKITSHPDFLPAADTHSIDPANHWLVALKNRRDHVVEQTHVLTVFTRRASVQLGILTSVSSAAERARARSGQDHSYRSTVVAGFAECENDFLGHDGGVAVEFARVV